MKNLLGDLLTRHLGANVDPSTVDWANRMEFLGWAPVNVHGGFWRLSEVRIRWGPCYRQWRVIEPNRGTFGIPARKQSAAADVVLMLERVVIPRVAQEILRDPDYYIRNAIQSAIYRHFYQEHKEELDRLPGGISNT